MKTRLLAVLLLGLACGVAGASESINFESLAKTSGLSVRQVKMVLGTGTSYAEYRTSYHRAAEQLRRAIGENQVKALSAQYRANQVSALASND